MLLFDITERQIALSTDLTDSKKDRLTIKENNNQPWSFTVPLLPDPTVLSLVKRSDNIRGKFCCLQTSPQKRTFFEGF